MINISSASNLDIIVPSKNKALAQVLSNASKTELETLSQGKDLKSILNTILRQSTDSTSTNKELLSLVKNNPTLKNLGSVTTTIQDLLSSLKSDDKQLPIEKTLKTFLADFKTSVLSKTFASFATVLFSADGLFCKVLAREMRVFFNST